MAIIIVTQNFPPQIGGIQTLMGSIADRLGQNGYKVKVFTDYKAPPSIFYTSNAIIVPKIFRNFIKKLFILKNLNQGDIIICDSWKSVEAIPKHNSKTIVFAHGQEYIVRKGKNKRIQNALNKTHFLIPVSNFTLNLIKNIWDINSLKYEVIPISLIHEVGNV